MNKYALFGLIGLFALPLMAAKYDLDTAGKRVKSFTVTCATTATLIDAGEPYTSVQCTQLDIVEVYLGGSDVSSANGYPICADRSLCGVSTQVISANNAYCRVAASTEVLRCLAVVE